MTENQRSMTGNEIAITKLLATSERAVSFMIGEITHICRDMKKRAPGSEGEREAAEYMAGVLKNSCGCKDVHIETFKEHACCREAGVVGDLRGAVHADDYPAVLPLEEWGGA